MTAQAWFAAGVVVGAIVGSRVTLGIARRAYLKDVRKWVRELKLLSDMLNQPAEAAPAGSAKAVR